MLAGGCDILCHIIHSLPVTAGLTVAKSRLGSKPQFWEDEHKRPGFVSYCLQCWLRKRYVVIRESAARVREAVPVARGSSIWRINLHLGGWACTATSVSGAAVTDNSLRRNAIEVFRAATRR